MKLIKLIILLLLLTPIINASNDESLEECGLIAYVFLFDDGFDPEYFESFDYIQAERLNPETSKKDDVIVQTPHDKVERQQK